MINFIKLIIKLHRMSIPDLSNLAIKVKREVQYGNATIEEGLETLDLIYGIIDFKQTFSFNHK